MVEAGGHWWKLESLGLVLVDWLMVSPFWVTPLLWYIKYMNTHLRVYQWTVWIRYTGSLSCKKFFFPFYSSSLILNTYLGHAILRKPRRGCFKILFGPVPNLASGKSITIRSAAIFLNLSRQFFYYYFSCPFFPRSAVNHIPRTQSVVGTWGSPIIRHAELLSLREEGYTTDTHPPISDRNCGYHRATA